MDLKGYLDRYLADLERITAAFQATDALGSPIPQNEALAQIQSRMKLAHARDGKLVMLGNGGSNGMLSHLSFDYTKNGGMRAMAVTDASYLTGGSNDLGYENLFAQWLVWHGKPQDLAICVSSSGTSANIVNAARKAREMGMFTVTLSAFGADNPLRVVGDINLWLDTGSKMYGYAENGHQIILHAILEHSIFGGPVT